MERVKGILRQLAGLWASLPTPKRIALVTISGLVLATVLFATYFGSRLDYVYLYSNLDPQDAAGIVERLKTLKVPYRLEADGRSIQVPEDQVASLRLELASAGLPRGGGVGFELFDRSQLGATEFEQQVSLRRALEGELTRSILTIDGVESTRVHLVMPERRLFVARQETASASVVVKLRSPDSFGKREVAGIVHLVAAAVPGLRRDRVSVVSTDGLTLHRPTTTEGDAGSGMGDGVIEQSEAVATQLEADVRSQLERVVGVGNAEVRIAVDLDTAAREMVEEHYEPSKTALRSENKTEERAGAGDPGVAGVPGAMTNLPDAQQPGAEATETTGEPGGGGTRLSQTRNWEIDKVSQKTVTPPGSIKRLSVAVLVNDKAVGKGMVARTPQELAKLEELVKRAVGFEPQRGDTLKVDSAAFARVSEAALSKASAEFNLRRWIVPAAALLGAAFLLAMLILVWRRAAPPPQRAISVALRPTSGGGVGALTGHQAPLGLAEGSSTDAHMESHALDGPMRRARAQQLAAEDPATAAIVIRKWLNAAAARA